MRFTWICAVRELRRLRRDPIQLGVWVGIPIFVAVLLLLVFGGEKVTPRGTLLVADEDGSLVSSFVAGAFNQGAMAEMFNVEKVDLDVGRRRMDKGDASALLHIPKGFGSAVLQGLPTRLKLVKNPSQSILPNIVEQVVGLLPDAAFYLQALAGDRLRVLNSTSAPPESQVVESAVAFNRLGNAVAGYLRPLRIELATEVASKPGVDTSKFSAALLRSMVFLAVLFLGLGFSGEIWKERRQGTLKRLLTAPARMESFLLGRCLALAIVLCVAVSAGLAVGNRVAAVPPGRLALGVAFVIPAGVAFYLLLQLVMLHAPSERGASILANLIMFPLGMIGGSFFPFEFMPQWMASIGRWTPNGWAVAHLGLILEGQVSAAQVMLFFAQVAAFGAVAFWLASRRLRRGFAL